MVAKEIDKNEVEGATEWEREEEWRGREGNN